MQRHHETLAHFRDAAGRNGESAKLVILMAVFAEKDEALQSAGQESTVPGGRSVL